MPAFTQLLEAASAGDPHAAADLLPLVYDELRKLATTRMAAEAPDHSLQPTALVHEAYVRLVGGEAGQLWNGRGHFFAAAAEAMRRILVETARRKDRIRHGGGHTRIDLDRVGAVDDDRGADDLLALNDALTRLETEHPEAAAVVKLRYFVGMTAGQAADTLGVSRRTADRHWAFARAWLFDALGGPAGV